LCHTIHHRVVLIIFPLNLQTITLTRMLSSGGAGRVISSITPRQYSLHWQTNSLEHFVRTIAPKVHSIFVASIIFDGRSLFPDQIPTKYLNLRLKCYYFQFLKTNGHLVGILYRPTKFKRNYPHRS